MSDLVYLKHNPKVVALVGMGPSITDLLNETLTQECSPKWCDEVWAINMVSNAIWHDVVFWMDDLAQQQNFKPGLFELLRRRNKPVITSKRHADILPNSYDYPISEISALSIPYFGKPYLTNGVAMAVGYALYKQVRVLKIYGCDFTYPNRNFAEEGRACTESWIALASIKGMEVQLSPSTSLHDSVSDQGIYGYAEQPEIFLPDGRKMKYTKPGAAPGKYSAEDSSGVTDHAVSSLLPRKPGQPSQPERPSADAGRPAEAPAAPAPGPGESMGPEDRHGRAEAVDLAGAPSGRANGHLQDAAEASVLSG